jgi:hypothetical protein
MVAVVAFQKGDEQATAIGGLGEYGYIRDVDMFTRQRMQGDAFSS